MSEPVKKDSTPIDYYPKTEEPAMSGPRQVFVTLVGIVGFTIILAIIFGFPILGWWLLRRLVVR